MAFSEADRVPTAKFNTILWKGLMGPVLQVVGAFRAATETTPHAARRSALRRDSNSKPIAPNVTYTSAKLKTGQCVR